MHTPDADQKPKPANAPEKREGTLAPKTQPNQHTEPPIGKVSTSGRTQGPHSPSFSKEDLEYFRTHLLSSKPLARFDTFGTVSHVLSEIDRYVPMVFGVEGENAINTLHKVIRHYSVNEKWTYVVASLSLGMARQEIETLLSRKLGNSGPIIIDPDASTETHQMFGSETEAKIQKERIIQANEATGKILLVLYAIDNPDGQKDREDTHLQDLARALGVLLEEDAKFRSLWSIPPLDGNMKERLEKIGMKIGEKEDPHAAGLHIMHAVFMEMRGIETASAIPIYMAIQRFGIIPSRWASLGIVDDAAELRGELAREAQEHRAKLARGWKPPEEKLREAAAHTDSEHRKEAAETIEQRNKATVRTEHSNRKEASETRSHELKSAVPAAQHSAKEAMASRLSHERDARHSREDDNEAARSRARLLYREAREDKLHDEHMALDARLEGLEFAAKGAEKSFFTHERVEAGMEFEVAEEQENNIETRERRNAQSEARASVEAEGTAEGPYSRLAETASELREDALDQRQRNEFALETRREGEREGADINEQRRDFAELREATPPQSEQAVMRAEQKEEMRNEQSQQAETPERLGTQAEARNENQQEARNTETPVGASRPQEEQANVLESEAPKDAPGTQTPDARAAQLERTQPDESSNPQLTAENRAVEEGGRPNSQGELDTEARREQMAAREDVKQEQIQAQVDHQNELPERSPETERAQAMAELNREQQEFAQHSQEQQHEMDVATEKDNQQFQDNTEDSIKKADKEIDRTVDRLDDMVRDDEPETPRDRFEREEVTTAEAEKKAAEKMYPDEPLSEAEVVEQANQTFDVIGKADEDTPDNYVTPLPEMLEAILSAPEEKEAKTQRLNKTAALVAEEAAEVPPPAAPPAPEIG